MTEEINIETREDWNEGEHENTSADIKAESGELGLGYVNPGEGTDTNITVEDLILYLRFDEKDGSTFEDYSTAGNDGEETDGSVDIGNGILATDSADFDGGYVNMGQTNDVLSDTPLTISLWARTSQTDRGSAFNMRDEDGGSTIQIKFEVNHDNTGDMTARWRTTTEAAGNDITFTDTDYNDDEWRHFVFVINSGQDQWTAYLDGEEYDTVAIDGSIDISSISNDFLIGEETEDDGTRRDRRWSGLIDEFMIFDKELSEAEVEELYFNGHENNNFEGEYTSVIFEPEEGEDVEVTELEITADIDTDASAEVTVEALDESDDIVDSDTITVSDGTDTYSVELDEAPKFRIISEHEVSL